MYTRSSRARARSWTAERPIIISFRGKPLTRGAKDLSPSRRRRRSESMLLRVPSCMRRGKSSPDLVQYMYDKIQLQLSVIITSYVVTSRLKEQS